MDSLKYFGLLLNMYYNIHNTYIHAYIIKKKSSSQRQKKMKANHQSSKKASSEASKDDWRSPAIQSNLPIDDLPIHSRSSNDTLSVTWWTRRSRTTLGQRRLERHSAVKSTVCFCRVRTWSTSTKNKLGKVTMFSIHTKNSKWHANIKLRWSLSWLYT